MANFLGLCHRSCTLGYIGEVLDLRKLDFMSLKGQFDVKKAIFIGPLRSGWDLLIHVRASIRASVRPCVRPSGGDLENRS